MWDEYDADGDVLRLQNQVSNLALRRQRQRVASLDTEIPTGIFQLAMSIDKFWLRAKHTRRVHETNNGRYRRVDNTG